MTECNGCGACCQPVMLPVNQREAATNPEMSAREKYWILHELTPMKRRLAKELAPWLFLPTDRPAIDAQGQPIMPFFYSCKWFDYETRSCRNWENRPPTCAGYPWYGEPPARHAVLPPPCSYREDIGQEVQLIQKPQR